MNSDSQPGSTRSTSNYRLIYLFGFGAFVGTVIVVAGTLARNPNSSCVVGFALIPLICVCEFGGLICLVLFISKKQFKNTFLTLIAMVIVPSTIGVSFLIGSSIGERRAEKAKSLGCERGDEIYAAISAFVQDTGNPPSSLDEIVPDYLKELPAVPGSGHSPPQDYNQWDYQLQPNGEFWLSFSTEAWDCTRASSTPQWDCFRMGSLGDVLD